MQENYKVDDVEASFRALTHQGEWLGFHIGPVSEPRQIELFPGSLKSHIQGMARSPRTGRAPVFYFAVSGHKGNEDSFPGIMVVELKSRPGHGERLGSNRLAQDLDTTDTSPPLEDKVLRILEDTESDHPSGLQMVGDILAVPAAGAIQFYDCREPTHPKRLDYKLAFCTDEGKSHGAQAVAITRLEDGRFLLLTNDGDYANFHWSEKTSFFDEAGRQVDDVFFHHDFETGVGNPKPENFLQIPQAELEQISDLDGNMGYWPAKDEVPWYQPWKANNNRRHQNLSFVTQADGTLFLIAATNSNAWSPEIIGGVEYYGKEELYLLRVRFPRFKDGLTLDGVAKATKSVRSPGRKRGQNPLDADRTLYSYTDFRKMSQRWQANFSAGAAAYVSPRGELIYYGASHFADGLPVEDVWRKHNDAYFEGDFVKMAEFTHRNVSSDGTCGLPSFGEKPLGGPYKLVEGGKSLELSALAYVVEPWVRMYGGG